MSKATTEQFQRWGWVIFYLPQRAQRTQRSERMLPMWECCQCQCCQLPIRLRQGFHLRQGYGGQVGKLGLDIGTGYWQHWQHSHPPLYAAAFFPAGVGVLPCTAVRVPLYRGLDSPVRANGLAGKHQTGPAPQNGPPQTEGMCYNIEGTYGITSKHRRSDQPSQGGVGTYRVQGRVEPRKGSSHLVCLCQ